MPLSPSTPSNGMSAHSYYFIFVENQMLIKEANMGIDRGNMGIDRTCEQLWEIVNISMC